MGSAATAMAGNILQLDKCSSYLKEKSSKLQMIEGNDCGKSVMITDRYRSNEKLVSAKSLDQFLEIGRLFLGVSDKDSVYAVLDDDGTEVDEEEYFQLLPESQILMILTAGQMWSPNFSLNGISIMDSSTNIFTTGDLTAALMEHIQKATVEIKKEKSGETSTCF